MHTIADNPYWLVVRRALHRQRLGAVLWALFVVLLYLAAFVWLLLAATGYQPDPDERLWFELLQVGAFTGYMIGNGMLGVLTFVAPSAVASAICEEWRRGTIHDVRVTPLPPQQMLYGIALSRLWPGLFVLLPLIPLLFHAPVKNVSVAWSLSVLARFMMLAAGLFCGLLAVSVTRARFAAIGLAYLLFAVIALLACRFELWQVNAFSLPYLALAGVFVPSLWSAAGLAGCYALWRAGLPSLDRRLQED